MKSKNLLFVCLSVLSVLLTGCSTTNGDVVSFNGGSASEQRVSSELISSKQVSSDSNVSNKKDQNDSEWVAYNSNKDNYKLHIKKKDGTEDKVIVNDPVLAPCVAGEWVYYIDPLIEIDKVSLDGSQKTKVCDIPEIMEINGSTAVTAEYKDGYILYKTQQLHEVGDNSSYPTYYYKLDPATNKISEVKGNL
jgi:hypothetical protein